MLIKKILANTTPVLAQVALNIVSVPLFVGTLGESDYGGYLLFNAIIASLSIFQIGIPKIVIRNVASATCQKQYGQALLNGTFSSFVAASIGSIILVLIECLSGIFSGSYSTIPFLFMVVISPLYYSFGMVSSYLIGLERYRANGLLLVITNTLSVVLALLLALLSFSLMEVIILSWGFKLFVFVVFWMLELHKLKIKTSVKVRIIKDRASLWVSFGMVSSVLIVHFDQIIISSIGVASFMALYKVIVTPYDVLQNVSRGILGVTLPRISKASVKSQEVRFRYVLLLQKRISFFLYTLALVAAVMSKSFIELWVPKYSDFSDMTVILCLFFGLFSSSAVFYNYFISINRLRIVSIFQLFLALANVLIGFFATDLFSWKSVIYANFITFTISFYFFAYYYFYIEKRSGAIRGWLLLNTKYLFLSIFAFFLASSFMIYDFFTFVIASFLVSIVIFLLLDLLLYRFRTFRVILTKSRTHLIKRLHA